LSGIFNKNFVVFIYRNGENLPKFIFFKIPKIRIKCRSLEITKKSPQKTPPQYFVTVLQKYWNVIQYSFTLTLTKTVEKKKKRRIEL